MANSIQAQQRQVLDRLLERLGPQNWWQNDNRLADWISMILVQQTTGRNTEKVIANMMPYMTVEQLSAMPTDELEQLIRPSGFYRQKTRSIQALLQWYQEHGAQLDAFKDVSTDELRTSLLSIRGVGDETADDMLLYIFDRPVFVADNYARKLFARLGVGEYKTYAAMKQATSSLMDGVSASMAQDWHAVIDEYGKSVRRQDDVDESWLIA